MDEGERGPAPRAGALERRSDERRRVYVPLARRKRQFLEALERSGDVTLAAEAAGAGRDEPAPLPTAAFAPPLRE